METTTNTLSHTDGREVEFRPIEDGRMALVGTTPGRIIQTRVWIVTVEEARETWTWLRTEGYTPTR